MTGSAIKVAYSTARNAAINGGDVSMDNIIMVTILSAPLVILALKEMGWWL